MIRACTHGTSQSVTPAAHLPTLVNYGHTQTACSICATNHAETKPSMSCSLTFAQHAPQCDGARALRYARAVRHRATERQVHIHMQLIVPQSIHAIRATNVNLERLHACMQGAWHAVAPCSVSAIVTHDQRMKKKSANHHSHHDHRPWSVRATRHAATRSATFVKHQFWASYTHKRCAMAPSQHSLYASKPDCEVAFSRFGATPAV